MLRRWLIALAFSCLAAVGTAYGFAVDQPLADPAQEARAQELAEQVRCLVCQNQSIAESNADLARDLRALVRERIAAGDSDEAVLDFMVARYGDWVLLRPPFRAETWALWLGPGLLLLVALVLVRLWLRRGGSRAAAPGPDAPLSAEERRRLDSLIADGDVR